MRVLARAVHFTIWSFLHSPSRCTCHPISWQPAKIRKSQQFRDTCQCPCGSRDRVWCSSPTGGPSRGIHYINHGGCGVCAQTEPEA